MAVILTFIQNARIIGESVLSHLLIIFSADVVLQLCLTGKRQSFLWSDNRRNTLYWHYRPCLSAWSAAYCSINEPPLNGGVINRTKLRPGSRLLYYCNRGYRLVGSSNATCRLFSNGLFQWDSPPPFCQGKTEGCVLTLTAHKQESPQKLLTS